MAGQKDLVKQAIHSPQIVYEGHTADDKMFRGNQIPGSGFRLGGKVIIAVVNYTARAKFLTAYSTTLESFMESRAITGRVGRLEISYDEDADVLYVSVGHPRVADTFDSDYGLLLRKNPQTQEIVGATILHYGGMFKKLLDRSWVKKLDLPGDLESYLLNPP
jgi:uncharacterized protein YuzE